MHYSSLASSVLTIQTSNTHCCQIKCTPFNCHGRGQSTKHRNFHHVWTAQVNLSALLRLNSSRSGLRLSCWSLYCLSWWPFWFPNTPEIGTQSISLPDFQKRYTMYCENFFGKNKLPVMIFLFKSCSKFFRHNYNFFLISLMV